MPESRFLPLTLLPFLVLFMGCRPVANIAADADSNAQITASPASHSNESSHSKPAKPSNVKAAWDLILLQDKPIGFAKTMVTEQATPGGQVARWEQVITLDISRFGETIRQTINLTSRERIQGGFVNGSWRQTAGDAIDSGHAAPNSDGTRLVISASNAPESVASIEIPWRPEFGGFSAVEQSLRSTPMRPGEERSVYGLLAMMNQVGHFRLQAHARESVALLEDSRKLLRIENEVRFNTSVADTNVLPHMHATLWMDESGTVHKQTIRELDQTIIRTTETRARNTDTHATDLGEMATVRLQHDLSSPPDLHGGTSARYRIRSSQPTSQPERLTERLIPNFTGNVRPIQNAKIAEDGSLELLIKHDTVSRVSDEANGIEGADRISQQERQQALQSSQMIQSDTSRIRELVQQAVADRLGGSITDPWIKACRFEAFVHGYIEQKDFSKLLLNSEQVAEQRCGDCTEHAVLLAALCRADGIPTRVVTGLVYVPSQDRFVFHMWNETLINNTWTSIDATLGQGGIGAGHIKLATSNLSDDGDKREFLLFAQLIGHIEIELIAIKD